MASIKDLKRMCKNITCKDCPLSDSSSNTTDCWVVTFPDSYPDVDIDEIVNEWISKHLVKTYAVDFFEKFPNTPRAEDGTPKICPQYIYISRISK